jgi:OOP family OmpA-OmpF porin
MKRLILATAVAAAFAFSGAAFGQGYIGGSIGQSDFKLDCAGLDTCDTKDTGYKLFGGYMFMPYFGVEAAYVDFGKATATVSNVPVIIAGERMTRLATPTTLSGSASLKASGFGLWAVGNYPIGNGALFAKLGLASIENKLDVTGTSGGFAASGSDKTTVTDIAYGLGGAYHFTKNLGVRVEWERFQGKIPGDEKFDLDLMSLGVFYRF